jgi:cytochrome c oxidase subunit 3
LTLLHQKQGNQMPLSTASIQTAAKSPAPSSTVSTPVATVQHTQNIQTVVKTNPMKAVFQSQQHPFHILGPSPFPALTGLFLFTWLVPQVFVMHGLFTDFLRFDAIHISVMGLYITVMTWFFTVLKESRHGHHTKRVQQGLRLGMILFIASEVMFFFAFFWAFFHYSLVPSIAIGAVWPPVGTQPLSPWGLPLVNTMLLLTSGVTITLAHAYIVKNKTESFAWYLFLTILLGAIFLFCQAYEYKYGVKFSWRDNVYGSIFFLTTGFHGFHVTIGTLFLLFCWVRQFFATAYPAWYAKNGEKKQTKPLLGAFQSLLESLGYSNYLAKFWAFTPGHHFGFESAAWYWHFVDVVWLFLYVSIYWWGGF